MAEAIATPAGGHAWRRRLLALGLGSALSLVLLGGLVRGAPQTSTPESSWPCNESDWQRTGCWQTPGGYNCYR